MVSITGATRLNIIIGDPIAQVKSPAGMTAAFAERGHDGVVVPVHVRPRDLDDFLDVTERLPNLDGIIVTVPHKFACFKHCASTTDRAAFLGTVNLMRRRSDGRWHGEMVDGVGFIGALQAAGCNIAGKRALLVGAGGAGSAIALALVDAGVRDLAIHDSDFSRRDDLTARLSSRVACNIVSGSTDPAGFDIVANATPAGMKPDDPLPIDVEGLSSHAAVGCVVTSPAVTPLIAAARAKGCTTSTGTQMYHALQTAMVEFLLAGARLDGA